MGLSWIVYDRFFTHGGTKLIAKSPEARLALEARLADWLELPASCRKQVWGSVSAPGRFAEVVRLSSGLDHRFAGAAQALGFDCVGIKIFRAPGKTSGEAVWFHQECWPNLHQPGAAVQRSLGAELYDGRAHAALEWVDGEVLEDLFRSRTWSLAFAHELVRQLFGDIIVPLWSLGLVFWDVRSANFVWQPAARRLVLIDTDSLAAPALIRENFAEQRARHEKWRPVALRRLRRLILVVLLGATARRERRALRQKIDEAWHAGLRPALARPLLATWQLDARDALERFLRRIG
ncbi:MAG TPA: hypothetical protein VJN18_11455 [Polyangiaceae bacterium]|nr:hypothetical protein [Polyangiaceae bacterium]